MQFMLFLLACIFSIVLSFDAVAQISATSSSGLTGRALRKQDYQVCTAQSVQQTIERRNRAEFVKKCMANRQGERRAAARALRKQDRQACTAQSVQQNIARRNRAEFVRKCMAVRQGERRATGR